MFFPFSFFDRLFGNHLCFSCFLGTNQDSLASLQHQNHILPRGVSKVLVSWRIWTQRRPKQTLQDKGWRSFLITYSSTVLFGILVDMYPWTRHFTISRVLPNLVHWQIFWLQTSLSHGATNHKTKMTCIGPVNIVTVARAVF